MTGLIVDKPKTDPEGKREYDAKDHQKQKFKRVDPIGYRNALFEVIKAINAFDRRMTIATQTEIDEFNRKFKKPPTIDASA